VIFSCMAMGFSPYFSNGAGYLIGLIFSYFLNKYYVFTSSHKNRKEALRFIYAFMIAYALNISTLHICLLQDINEYYAQVVAAFVYTIVMYSISRYKVFRRK
jgi:putative flippase GtrA